MGIISFIKDVGSKIFNGNSANAAELKDSIDKHGLETKDLKVEVEGDKVVLAGKVKDKETLEKAILAAGNNAGIASVDTDAVEIEQKEEQPQDDTRFTQLNATMEKLIKTIQSSNLNNNSFDHMKETDINTEVDKIMAGIIRPEREKGGN